MSHTWFLFFCLIVTLSVFIVGFLLTLDGFRLAHEKLNEMINPNLFIVYLVCYLPAQALGCAGLGFVCGSAAKRGRQPGTQKMFPAF